MRCRPPAESLGRTPCRSRSAQSREGCREADRNQAQVGASKAHEGATAKSALDEATEQLEEVMKELPEANTELDLLAGSIAPEVSTDGSGRGIFHGSSDGTALVIDGMRLGTRSDSDGLLCEKEFQNGRKVLEGAQKQLSRNNLTRYNPCSAFLLTCCERDPCAVSAVTYVGFISSI